MASAESELWELVGTRWKLPIYVTWTEPEIGYLTPAIPLLKIQVAAFLFTLEGKIWSCNEKLWIGRSSLMDIAYPSKEEDPERILVWLSHDVVEVPPEEQTDSSWIEYVRMAGFIKDKDLIRLYWLMFVNCMIGWMFREGRTLDLHFCRMRAVPFRHDYKRVLSEIWGKSRGPSSDSEIEELLRRMIHPDMMSFLKAQGKARWTLDVMLTQLWDLNVKNKNAAIMATGKPYWQSIVNEMKLHLEWAYEAFLDYLSEVHSTRENADPCVREVLDLAPEIWGKPIRPDETGLGCHGVHAADVRQEIPCGDECVDSETPSVRELPDI